VTPEVRQRTAALSKANRVRLARADAKRAIGELPPDLAKHQVVRVLLDPPVFWETARIEELLAIPHGVGPAKLRRWIADADITRRQTVIRVGQLTGRERGRLAGVIVESTLTRTTEAAA